jgi:hypothetical protein
MTRAGTCSLLQISGNREHLLLRVRRGSIDPAQGFYLGRGRNLLAGPQAADLGLGQAHRARRFDPGQLGVSPETAQRGGQLIWAEGTTSASQGGTVSVLP